MKLFRNNNATGPPERTPLINHDEDDNIDNDGDDAAEIDDTSYEDDCYEPPGADGEGLRRGTREPRRSEGCYTTSTDCVELHVGHEVPGDHDTTTKKTKKPLKKRVRKRMWRVMRSSWKYFRRGMAGYSPVLAAMFNWGINFQQTAQMRPKTDSRYF